MFEGIFYFFLSAISSAMSTWLFLVRNFASRFIITSKFIFVNLLNSGVVIKIVVSDILFSISLAFIFGPDLVARLIIPVIFNISYFISNLCGLNFLSLFFFCVVISLLDQPTKLFFWQHPQSSFQDLVCRNHTVF